MHFVTCIVAVAPLRADSSHRSEMVSQLLFGECATVIDEAKDFYRVRCLYDNYEGWCQKSQLNTVEEDFYNRNHNLLTAEPVSIVSFNGKNMLLPPGCFIGCFENGEMHIDKHVITFAEQPFEFAETSNEQDIYGIMHPYINAPYLWGGKSIFGIDCSGFTQQVYKMLDVKLRRDAYQQAEQGEVIGFLQEAKCGDLAFFDNEEGRITHVGILLDSENIIHASGKVRIDKIDNMGIINSNTNERTHRLRLLKRYINL